MVSSHNYYSFLSRGLNKTLWHSPAPQPRPSKPILCKTDCHQSPPAWPSPPEVTSPHLSQINICLTSDLPSVQLICFITKHFPGCWVVSQQFRLIGSDITKVLTTNIPHNITENQGIGVVRWGTIGNNMVSVVCCLSIDIIRHVY